MRNHIAIFLLILFAGCQQQVRKENMTSGHTVHYPLLIDNGKRMLSKREHLESMQKVHSDTVKLTKGQLYQRDTVNHPLRQFYLAYPEWKKTRCIIAVDETDYLDKAMIGVIEKTGALRLHYNQQKIYLLPVKKVKMKEGEYKEAFKNDTLEIQLSARLDPGKILRCLTGNGTLIVKNGNQTIVETVFLVHEIEQ